MIKKIDQDFESEIASRTRFEFGKNWSAFLNVLNDERIERSRKDLATVLQLQDLDGLRFLDAGSGSGLSSLVARQLGATVTSFDFDPASVACTKELKARYQPGDQNWIVQEGSVLDTEFLGTLGKFDIAMSWGVLHHTGSMWQALSNMGELVNPGGILFIAIYNDQGFQSRVWLHLKKTYVAAPKWLKLLLIGVSYLGLWGPTVVRDTLSGKPLKTWQSDRGRGMSPHHDMVDWVGGLPFEVATREEIVSYFAARGFELVNLVSVGRGLGCNEFVFKLGSVGALGGT